MNSSRGRRTTARGATNSITAKNKELSNPLVTDALRNRFALEIQKLEVGSVPIELRKEADRTGQSFLKVALVGKPNEPVGNILSEGEVIFTHDLAFLFKINREADFATPHGKLPDRAAG